MTSEWAISTILASVITRLHISGVNPLDLAYVIKTLDSEVHLNASFLGKRWYQLWTEKGRFYCGLARKAEGEKQTLTARALFLEAARSYLAAYLIHSQDVSVNREHYTHLKNCFSCMLNHCSVTAEKVIVQLDDKKEIAAYLFVPQAEKIVGSVVFYAGLGSCKEEMHFLVESIVDRGVAVLIPDMPGCGESLFDNGVQCFPETVEAAYRCCLRFLREHMLTRGFPIGSSGLCMGGGYAFRAAALNSEYALCATLFPLFISEVAEENTPQWMKCGKWFDFQTGNADGARFQKQMGFRRDEKLMCPFFLVHGESDNWMTVDSALQLLDNINNPIKDKLIIEEGLSGAAGQKILHSLPVGEQLHWVRHLFADWIRNQFVKNEDKR